MNIRNFSVLLGVLTFASVACKPREYGEGSTKSIESSNPLSPYAKCYTTAQTSSYADSHKKPGKLLYTCEGEREGLDVCVIGFDGGAWVVENSTSTKDFMDDHIFLQFDKAEKSTGDELNLSKTDDEALISTSQLPNGTLRQSTIGNGKMMREFKLDKKSLTATYRRTFKGCPTASGYNCNQWAAIKGHDYTCRAVPPGQQ